MSESGFRYIGTGESFIGLPARDIPSDEYEALGPLEKRTLRESGVYVPVSPEPEQPEQPEQPAPRKGRNAASSDEQKETE